MVTLERAGRVRGRADALPLTEPLDPWRAALEIVADHEEALRPVGGPRRSARAEDRSLSAVVRRAVAHEIERSTQ